MLFCCSECIEKEVVSEGKTPLIYTFRGVILFGFIFMNFDVGIHVDPKNQPDSSESLLRGNFVAFIISVVALAFILYRECILFCSFCNRGSDIIGH